jgi:hypothetical protein
MEIRVWVSHMTSWLEPPLWNLLFSHRKLEVKKLGKWSEESP